MKSIEIATPLSKNIDFNFLDIKYKNIDISNYDLDTEINLLKDVDKGALLIEKHMNNNSHIVIVTDYDSDGINSAIVLTKGLRNIFRYKNTTTIVNKRINGNGFNRKLVNKIIELHLDKKIDLIITADHGSNDFDAYATIKEKCTGVEILVTDHHTISKYPDNVEVFVNPMREDSTYPKSISGCCTAFLVLVQLAKIKNMKFDKLYEIIPYVAISTITDIMDMSIPYNRFIVELGLRIMNSERFIFWHILKLRLKLGIKINVFDLGFKIGPLINCGNTVNREEIIFKMLIEQDVDKMDNYIKEVELLNKLRKDLTKKYSDIIEKELPDTPAICLTVDVKEEAILNGKIASSLGNKYSKPTIIFSSTNNSKVYNGSGRAIVPNLNILDIMHKIKNDDNTIFEKYGGHYGALGCSVYKDKFESFQNLFYKYVLETAEVESKLKADVYVHPKDVNVLLYEQQERYSPFGENMKPPVYVSIFRVDRAMDFGPIAKLNLYYQNYKVDGKYFFSDKSITKDNIKELRDKLFFIAFTLDMSTFRGSYGLDLNILRVEEIIR